MDLMMRHRFIVSAGRAGTTFMARALNMHPQVCCQIESHHLPLLMEAFGARAARPRALLAVMDQARFANHEPVINFSLKRFGIGQSAFFEWQQDLIARHEEMTIKAFQEALVSFLLKETGKSIFVDKTPCYGWRLPQLRATLKDIRVVNMVRDCIPSVKSMSKHPGFVAKLRLGETNWTDVLLKHRYWALEEFPPLSGQDDFAGMGKIWAARTAVPNSFADQPPVLDLRYEDLLEKPYQFLRALCNQLDIPFEFGWADEVNQLIKEPAATGQAEPVDKLKAILEVPEIRDLRKRLGYSDETADHIGL